MSLAFFDTNILIYMSLRTRTWDALIVESSLRAKAEVLYTEDLQHGQVIDGLRIENPFRVMA
jgi:predicted nucleic acid-binding protein